jgi:hypothetical protein
MQVFGSFPHKTRSTKFSASFCLYIQLLIQRVPRALSLWVEWPGREADHSLPSSTNAKNAWNSTSTPQYVFMASYLVKHRDFTFYSKGKVVLVLN